MPRGFGGGFGGGFRGGFRGGGFGMRRMGFPLLGMGFGMGPLMTGLMAGGLGYVLMLAGVGAFSLTVIFQIVNLPVEFDASSRAKVALAQLGIVHENEMEPIRRVLSAAAMTYVAATLTAILTLLYYLWRLGIIGGGDRRN